MKPSLEADKVYLVHMPECAGRIDEYVGGDETRFRASRLVQDAVVRNLQTLAESSQRLTDAIKASEPDVPWRAIAGFRNILVHAYLAVDVDAVWLVLDQELPRLRAAGNWGLSPISLNFSHRHTGVSLAGRSSAGGEEWTVAPDERCRWRCVVGSDVVVPACGRYARYAKAGAL